jgi:hypothetical protein
VIVLSSPMEAFIKKNLLDRVDMGGRYIEVFCVNRNEVVHIMTDQGRRGDKTGRPGAWRGGRDSGERLIKVEICLTDICIIPKY